MYDQRRGVRCEGSSSRYCCRGLFEQWLLVASQVEGNNGSTNKEEARVKAEVPCTYNVACWSGHAENSAASCVPCQEESDAKALDLPKVIKREGKIVIKPRNGTLNTFPSHNKRAAGILHTFCIINSSPQYVQVVVVVLVEREQIRTQEWSGAV